MVKIYRNIHSLFTLPAALCAGAIALALSFPRWNMAYLAWISIVPLMFGTIRRLPKHIFFQGWFFGTVSCAISFSWVTHSMTVYGNLSSLLSGFALFLMAAYLGIFPALSAWLAESSCRLHRGSIPRAFLWPVAWVGMEYVRARLPFGMAFPWNSLGQSQHNVPYILQNADWGSFYGISFLIVLVNYGLFAILFRADRKRWAASAAALALVAATGYGAWRYHEKEAGKPFRVGIVQGNIDLAEKWRPETRSGNLLKHIELSRELLPKKPELIIWSESSISFLYRYAWRYDDTNGSSLGAHLGEWLNQSGIPLLTGTLDRAEDDVFNAVVLASPDGSTNYFYKQRLVPFGEYVPLKPLFFFVNRLVEDQIGEFVPGSSIEPLRLPGDLDMAITICYENVFPELVRERVQAGAELICNVTNDAWFGRTSAAYQHFSAARFRAVENRRPVIRCANSGISGAVDSRGRVITQSDLFTRLSFVTEVIPGSRKTIYMRFGDWFAMGCFFAICVIYVVGVFFRFFRRR